jgi:protein O-GlcNAcase/histone acetyltransferase
MGSADDFLVGAIEGFYGPPWSQGEREELFGWMAQWGLNTYLYAPKDDLKHRALWREAYSVAETEALGQVIQACDRARVRFIYALSPGLDIQYHDPAELARIQARFDQLMALGCRHFALLFDDIPDQMSALDRKRWDCFASAQGYVANAMFRWTRERCPETRFLFCPTPYCGRMARRGFGGENYLPTLGKELLAEIDIFWTGPEIISREISVEHIRELQGVLRRKPVIWDNLHANDYDGRRFYVGPYAGRAPELKSEVRGILSNPNNEFPLNYVPLRTLAEFAHHSGAWDARQAYLSAMAEWLPSFAAVGSSIALPELILLGDCYYLPHEHGEAAHGLLDQARRLWSTSPAEWGAEAGAFLEKAAQLKRTCARMTELRQRPLFYALSRRVWELREELDLLERYVTYQSGRAAAADGFTSDFHLPGTYRGGLVPELQRLLEPRPDETLIPATPERSRRFRPDSL